MAHTWHGFLQRMREFEEVGSRTFFTSLFSDFFYRRFGNTWQLAFNRVHEASKNIIYNSRMASLSAT
jgi:hypothetical protein